MELDSVTLCDVIICGKAGHNRGALTRVRHALAADQVHRRERSSDVRGRRRNLNYVDRNQRISAPGPARAGARNSAILMEPGALVRGTSGQAAYTALRTRAPRYHFRTAVPVIGSPATS